MASDFERAVEFVRSMPPKGAEQPSTELKLRFYALYKQATVGDCDSPQPSFYQFEAKSKWNAWMGVKGMAKEQAQAEYVRELDAFDPEWRQRTQS